jgi:hypothetical protein
MPNPEEDVQVTYDSENPGNTMGQIIERNNQRHRQDYEPIENRMIESLDDMSIIENAQDRVDNNGFRNLSAANARNTRNAKRMGFRRTTSDVVNSAFDLQRGQAKSNADTMNNARLNQFDRNRDLRNKLINVGRGVQDQGMDALSSASQLEASRDNAYDTAKTNARNSNVQAGTSLLTTAMMIAAFSTSDERIKDNVETIDSALDKVAQMRGVYFTRNDLEEEDNAVRRTGVIAQEVQAVLPEVVVQSDYDVEGIGPVLAVEYGSMVGVLIEAVKELKAQIEELREG